VTNSGNEQNEILYPERIDALLTIYRNALSGDMLPFWIDHCVDHEYSAFTFCLDRDGTDLAPDLRA